jgi:hypothetical protein
MLPVEPGTPEAASLKRPQRGRAAQTLAAGHAHDSCSGPSPCRERGLAIAWRSFAKASRASGSTSRSFHEPLPDRPGGSALKSRQRQQERGRADCQREGRGFQKSHDETLSHKAQGDSLWERTVHRSFAATVRGIDPSARVRTAFLRGRSPITRARTGPQLGRLGGLDKLVEGWAGA